METVGMRIAVSNCHTKTPQAVKSDGNSYISSPCSALCWRLLFCNLPSGLCDMTSRNVARDTASPSGEHSGRGCLTACSSGPCSFTVPMCCNGVGYFSCKQKKRQGVHIDFPKQISNWRIRNVDAAEVSAPAHDVIPLLLRKRTSWLRSPHLHPLSPHTSALD